MKVSDVMTTEPEYVSPSTPISEVAAMMRDKDIGMVLVADDDARLIGAVTDRDLVIRGLAEGRDLSEAPVAEMMTDKAVCCFEDQELSEVARVMEHEQIRRLAILSRDKKLVGVVSLGDIAAHSKNNAIPAGVMKHVARPPESHPV